MSSRDTLARPPTLQNNASSLNACLKAREPIRGVPARGWCHEGGPGLDDLARQGGFGKRERSGCWLTQLQAFWLAGSYQRAANVSRRAASGLDPLMPTADVVSYHLFSALALGRLNQPCEGAALAMHCLELNRLARAGSASVVAIAGLATAVRDRCAGKTLVALSGLEQAADLADQLGQHWIAAIAAEEAALAASKARLHCAAGHYRRRALVRYKRWGALGRIDMLGREWGCVNQDFTDEDGVAGERLDNAGKAGELDLSIAHEVSQPLAAIALHSAAARKWLGRPEPNVERALASLDLISEAARHAGEIVGVIKRLACHEDGEIECINVDQAINDVLRLLQCNLHRQGIKTELALTLDSATIHANRVQFRQVITNLLVNSIEALSGVPRSHGGRCIRIASGLANEREVEITVEDNGPGIAPAHRHRIFSSRFTTKAGNSGVGLSISDAIVRAHRGCIAFEPGEPGGARFRIRLPAHRPQ